MNLDKLIFPIPTPTYTSASLNELIWIPRTRLFSMKSIMKDLTPEGDPKEPKTLFDNSKMFQIPCLYQKSKQDCKDIILYFHGNAEDLGMCESFGRNLSLLLKVNVLTVEFPGYGIYKSETSEKAIIEDSEIVYDFLVHEVGLSPDNIIVLGRSLGSAPALHLASTKEIKSLALISAFTSIKDIVRDNYGSLVSYLISERFENVEKTKKVKCSALFIHGEDDELISFDHSKSLLGHCKSPAKLHVSRKMAHNKFDVVSDIIVPIHLYFGEVGVMVNYGETLDFPDYVFKKS